MQVAEKGQILLTRLRTNCSLLHFDPLVKIYQTLPFVIVELLRMLNISFSTAHLTKNNAMN